MFQSWREVLFAHWRVPTERLRPLIPASLVLEEFEGSSWVGLVPFQIRDLRAANTAAVLAARLGYLLPYFRAEMRVESVEGWVHYRSRRSGGRAEFVGRYAPMGAVRTAERGTLEHFLVERYALYAAALGGWVLRGDIHHRPWPLQTAEATIDVNTVLHAHGIEPASDEPLLHYAARQDTLVWLPALVR